MRFHLLAVSAFILVPVVHADIYKWVDQDGVVYFSDRPPAHSAAKGVQGNVDYWDANTNALNIMDPVPLRSLSETTSNDALIDEINNLPPTAAGNNVEKDSDNDRHEYQTLTDTLKKFDRAAELNEAVERGSGTGLTPTVSNSSKPRQKLNDKLRSFNRSKGVH